MTSKLKGGILEVVEVLILLMLPLVIRDLTCESLLQIEVAHARTIVVEVKNIHVLRILLGVEEELHNHVQRFKVLTVQYLLSGLLALTELVISLVEGNLTLDHFDYQLDW